MGAIPLAGQTAQLASMLGPEGAAVGAVLQTADKVVGAFKAMADEMLSFTKLSNPGLFKQVNQAFDNLSASLGKLFEPIVQTFIPIANLLNAVFTSLGEVFKPVFSAFRDLIAVYVELYSTLEPLLKLIGEWNPLLMLWTAEMKIAGEALKYITAVIQLITGTTGADAKKTKAVTESSFVGHEDLGKQFRMAALNTGGGQDPQISIQNDIAEIKKTILEWFGWIKGVKETAGKALDTAGDIAGYATGYTPAKAAVQWIGGLFS